MHERERERVLRRVLERVTQREAGGGAVEPVDDEALALLATGDAHQLAPAERRRLLAQVTADAAAMRLLAELAEVQWEAAPDDTEGQPPARATTGGGAFPLLRIVPWLWAVAACVLLMLGVWEWAAPAVDGGPPAFPAKGPPPDAPGMSQLRTVALWTSFGITLLLTPLALWAWRQTRRLRAPSEKDQP